MPISIIAGPSTIFPVQDLGYRAARASNNVIHKVIGRAAPVVTLRPASLRTGTLDLLFLNAGDAERCSTALAQPLVFRYLDSDLPTAAMRFVVNGNIGREVDTESGLWMVHVDYQEVA